MGEMHLLITYYGVGYGRQLLFLCKPYTPNPKPQPTKPYTAKLYSIGLLRKLFFENSEKILL